MVVGQEPRQACMSWMVVGQEPSIARKWGEVSGISWGFLEWSFYSPGNPSSYYFKTSLEKVKVPKPTYHKGDVGVGDLYESVIEAEDDINPEVG